MFLLDEFVNFCNKGGIKTQRFDLTHPQNGTVEKRNRTIVEMPKYMIQSTKVPNKIWAKTVHALCVLEKKKKKKNPM